MPTSSTSSAYNWDEMQCGETPGLEPGRPPDYAGENAHLLRLVRALRDQAGDIMMVLANTALEACGAGSAGISILETPEGAPARFRWLALAGAWRPYQAAFMPRTGSPSGRVLERNELQVICGPLREFPGVAQLRPHCQEALLVPFCLEGVPIGALWVVKHELHQHFDSEDARVLTNLADFASAAHETSKSFESLRSQLDACSDANAVLMRADRSKDAFIATIAHELRDPLAPLVNASAVLKLGAGDSAVVVRASDLVLRQVRTISRLAEDLLDVSRVRLGMLALRTSKVDLSDILRSAVAAGMPVIAQNQHRLELGPMQPVQVIADEIRISQVLRNLLSNAAKYTDATGLITVALRCEAAEAVVTVCDTGIGIPSDQLETVFDLFAQSGQAGTQRSNGGLGIGLHLARQLVVAHGGSLTAESPGTGLGSTFTMRLPRAPPQSGYPNS